MVPTLLAQIPTEISQFIADGAYDTHNVYSALETAGTAEINIVIPPKKRPYGILLLKVHGNSVMQPFKGSKKSGEEPGGRKWVRLSKLTLKTQCVDSKRSQEISSQQRIKKRRNENLRLG